MNRHFDNGKIVIRDVVESDIQYLKNNLRKSDCDEVKASSGSDPERAIRASVGVSAFSATVLHKGKPVAVFGYSFASDTAASPWLLATDGIYEMRYEFLRLSRRFIKLMLDACPYLYNFIDARNKVTARWLKWCGATFRDPIPYGVSGLPFIPFVIKRED